jgi:hypothetical protein
MILESSLNRMVKRISISQSNYCCLVLCLCLTCMSIHVFVDSTDGFGLIHFASPIQILADLVLHAHAHEDDFLFQPVNLDAGSGSAVTGLVDLYWEIPSETDAPSLRPPKPN